MWQPIKFNYSIQTQNNYNIVNNFLEWKGNGDAYYMCIKYIVFLITNAAMHQSKYMYYDNLAYVLIVIYKISTQHCMLK